MRGPSQSICWHIQLPWFHQTCHARHPILQNSVLREFYAAAASYANLCRKLLGEKTHGLLAAGFGQGLLWWSSSGSQLTSHEINASTYLRALTQDVVRFGKMELEPPTKTPPLCPVGAMALLLFESSHGLPTNRYLQLQWDEHPNLHQQS